MSGYEGWCVAVPCSVARARPTFSDAPTVHVDATQ